MLRRNFVAGLFAFLGLGGAAKAAEPTSQVLQLKRCAVTPLRPVPIIRVWKLGSLEHQIYPSEKAIQKLADILTNHDWNNDLELIWGPDIQVYTVQGYSNVELITDDAGEVKKVIVHVNKDVEVIRNVDGPNS